MNTPSITSWNRLEPKQRSSDYGLSLQTRVHDPLWMLARQWQVGEFEGEDAASPIKVDIDASFVRLSKFSSKSSDSEAYSSESLPLEVAVEKEKLEFSTIDVRLRAELGNEFLKFVSANNINDPDRRTLLEVVGFKEEDEWSAYPFIRKSIDATKLMQVESHELSDAFGNPDNDILLRLESTVGDWKTWAKKTIFGSEYSHAWNPERQEYAFSVAAPGFDDQDPEITLSVDQYPGGHLDWPSFSLDSNKILDATGSSGSSTSNVELELMPMPVEISGMPSQRWWEFDDHNIDFGSIETAPQDISRMLLAHFALISGNNWFSIPMELPVGSLTKVKKLQVTNTFGEVFEINQSSAVSQDVNSDNESPWRVFHISSTLDNDEENQKPFLFLPPSLGPSLHSETVEEVRFIRDEMVNAAWLIEHVVQNSITGGVVNRHEKYYNQNSGFNKSSLGNNLDTPLDYALTTDVPDYWFPLLRVLDGQGNPSDTLQVGSLLRDPDKPKPELLGEISKELKDSGIFDEELPREGIFVYRQFQFARWCDGSSYLWISRRKRIGRGEGASNLKFDSIDLNE
jgi:hypothetical protein